MADLELKRTVTTKTQYEIQLHKPDLLRLLRDSVLAGLPLDATVTIRVPGGGDWSNTNLELEHDEHPLVITWTTETEYADND